MKIAFWGSSLVSAYWNGAATYYRGILRALAQEGFEITFFEPDAYERQKHRDIADPAWAHVVVYDPDDSVSLARHLAWSAGCAFVVKASGVGVLDELLEARVAAMPEWVCKIFWDVDAPATLDRLSANPADLFHAALPCYDLVLTYGGGDRVTGRYREVGAQQCFAIYNALDPDTHFPVPPEERFRCDLSFLGNRLPDREARVSDFFFGAAQAAPGSRFLLGGNGWADRPMPANLNYAGHVYTADHNAFNCSGTAVLNISRESMARYGFSPATRVFEAAGAGCCLLTDRWDGIDLFLQPEAEVLVVDNGEHVAHALSSLTPARAHSIGDAARRRVLAEHTYRHRGILVAHILKEAAAHIARTSLRSRV